MKNSTAVSVVIPTYNRFPLLCEAIDSVLAQTDPDYELIVVDDGSTDGTASIPKIYRGRLRYIYQENRGAGAARNRGAGAARGHWVSFLDSDDLWMPRKLEIQKAAMEAEPEVRISYTEEIWYRRGVRVNPRRKHAKYSGWIFEQCLPLCIISPSSVMMQNSFFQKTGGFDEDLPVCEDYDLWLRISRHEPVFLIREPLIIKRNGYPGQLSASGWGFDRYRVQSIKRLLDAGSLTEKQTRAACQVLKQKCRILVQGFSKRGNVEMERYYQGLYETACRMDARRSRL